MWPKSKATKERREEKNLFIENGARLLEELILSFDGKSHPIRNFSSQELLKATNNFSSTQLLCTDGFYEFYKGTFDGYGITVEKWHTDLPDRVKMIMNEIATVSQINHKNILKLLGCCLETEVPIVVYEPIVSNRVLSDSIFRNGPTLPWDIRLRIATDIANAVSYLHTALSTPIIHRDIKSRSIFLDENYVAKLSNFALLISIPLGETHAEDKVAGTTGYIDPEYLVSGRITEKTDVHNFGMVLLELLTGKPCDKLLPLAPKDNLSLTHYCRSFIEHNRLIRIVDSRIWGEEEVKKQQLQAFAELAIKCIEKKGLARPTMITVTKELRRIERFS